MIRSITRILFFLSIPSVAFGSIADELEKLVDELNTPVNVTKGDVYKSQRAGHVTGGVLPSVIRLSIENHFL